MCEDPRPGGTWPWWGGTLKQGHMAASVDRDRKQVGEETEVGRDSTLSLPGGLSLLWHLSYQPACYSELPTPYPPG